MRISFAVFADGANLSQEGKLNVLGVFDAVQVATLPTVHPRTHLVIRLKGDEADLGAHRMTLRWIDPGGSELWSSTGELNVAGAIQPEYDMDLPVIAVVDLPLSTTGRYVMQVVLDDDHKADVVLIVTTSLVQPPMRSGGMLVS
jgi:hypothetical protein